MILRGFPVAHGDKVPSPGIVTEQRQRPPFAEPADNQERRSRRQAVAACGNERFAAHATYLVQSGQCWQLAPSLSIALREKYRQWEKESDSAGFPAHRRCPWACAKRQRRPARSMDPASSPCVKSDSSTTAIRTE